MSEILNFWENLENLEIENFKINFSALFRPPIRLKMIPFEPPDFFTHIWSGVGKFSEKKIFGDFFGTRFPIYKGFDRFLTGFPRYPWSSDAPWGVF